MKKATKTNKNIPGDNRQRIQAFSYGTGTEKREVPEGYVCSCCSVFGVKLWREYQTFGDVTELTCARCTLVSQKKTHTKVDEFGLREETEFGGYKTDQIGWRVPAVPTEDGSTFWGYTSTPREGYEWWKHVPTTL